MCVEGHVALRMDGGAKHFYTTLADVFMQPTASVKMVPVEFKYSRFYHRLCIFNSHDHRGRYASPDGMQFYVPLCRRNQVLRLNNSPRAASRVEQLYFLKTHTQSCCICSPDECGVDFSLNTKYIFI